jgi:hypothetical protein
MIQGTLEFTDAEKQRAESHADKILRRLQQGPALSTDLIAFTHRFSASIRTLRVRGYQIEVEKLEDGTSLHSLKGYTPLVEATEEMQLAYYATEHWVAKRFERMTFDGFRCCHCKSADSLQVHHWAYELFAESIEDLMTLCGKCHDRMHAYDCVKAHFPEYVTAEIAERITGKSAMTFRVKERQ